MDVKKKAASPYPEEFRVRAVQMVSDHIDSYRSLTAAVVDISRKLGCSVSGVMENWTCGDMRNWTPF